MIFKKLKNFWDKQKEDRRLDKILKEGQSPFFSDNESDHEGELSITELKFMGWGVHFPKKTSRQILYDTLAEEYSFLKRAKGSDDANMAISVEYIASKRCSRYKKYIKHRDGNWYTLNCFIRVVKVNVDPTPSKNWLLFVV